MYGDLKEDYVGVAHVIECVLYAAGASRQVCVAIRKRIMLELRHAGKIAALVIAVPTTAVLLYWLFLRSDDGIDDCGDNNEVTTVLHCC